jgi:hypothetical protein
MQTGRRAALARLVTTAVVTTLDTRQVQHDVLNHIRAARDREAQQQDRHETCRCGLEPI